MKSFFDDLKTAVFGFNEYNKLTKQPFYKTVLFICVICILSGIIFISPFMYRYISTGGIKQAIEQTAKDFTIKNGVFTTDKTYDGIVETDFLPYIHIKADPNNNYSEKDIPDISNDLVFLGIYKDKTVFYQLGIKTNVFDNKNLELCGITDKASLIRFASVMQFFVAAFMLCVHFTSSFMEILIVYLCARLVCSMLETGLKSIDIIKICAYARTMPVVLFSLLAALSNIFPYTDMPYTLYLILYGAYVFIVIKNYKSEKDSKTDINTSIKNNKSSKADDMVICDIDNFDSSKFE